MFRSRVPYCVQNVLTGTTFPLVFTIQQAFTRRDKAITLIANLKATAAALYYMHRDWAQVRCQDKAGKVLKMHTMHLGTAGVLH
jgi:hypothetical protein